MVTRIFSHVVANSSFCTSDWKTYERFLMWREDEKKTLLSMPSEELQQDDPMHRKSCQQEIRKENGISLQ